MNEHQKLLEDWDIAHQAKIDAYMVPGKAETKKVKKQEYFDRLMAYKMWYEGDQWTVRPDGTDMDTSNDISYPTINFIKTIIDQKAAMLKRRKVSFYTKPVEEEDVDGSRMISELLRYIWKKDNIQTKIALAYKDSLIYGCGIQKVRWDGKNVTTDVISPLNFYPDKFGYNIDEMRFVHIVYEKTAEYLNWKYKGKKKEEPDEKGRVVVYETWYNPSDIYPDGKYFLWTEKQILKEMTLKELCRKTTQIPIVVYRHNPSTDSFWGTSDIKTLAEIQLIHNKSLGFILDNLILTNNAGYKTTDPKLGETMDNSPGKIYHVDDMNDLQPLATPQINPQWFAIAQYTGYPLFQQVSGTYAVNLGGASGTKTSSGIIALQQAGGVLPEADFIDVKESARKVAKLIIDYAFDFYTESEIYSVVDTEVPKSSIDLTKDIFVDFGDTLPDDKIARINLLSQMLQIGAINKAQFIEMLDDPTLNKYAKEAQEEVQAQQAQQQQLQQLQQAQKQQQLQKGQEDLKSAAESRVANMRQQAKEMQNG